MPDTYEYYRLCEGVNEGVFSDAFRQAVIARSERQRVTKQSTTTERDGKNLSRHKNKKTKTKNQTAKTSRTRLCEASARRGDCFGGKYNRIRHDLFIYPLAKTDGRTTKQSTTTERDGKNLSRHKNQNQTQNNSPLWRGAAGGVVATPEGQKTKNQKTKKRNSQNIRITRQNGHGCFTS